MEAKRKRAPSTGRIKIKTLVIKALTENKENADGIALQGLKTYISRYHPEVISRTNFKTNLKKAILNGMERDEIKRARGYKKCVGVQGRFKLKVPKPQVEKQSRGRSASPKGAKAGKPAADTATTSRPRSTTPSGKSKGAKSARPALKKKPKTVSKSSPGNKTPAGSKSTAKSKSSLGKKSPAEAKTKIKSDAKKSKKASTTKKASKA